jgi:hypothetical protein
MPDVLARIQHRPDMYVASLSRQLNLTLSLGKPLCPTLVKLSDTHRAGNALLIVR